MFIQHPLSTQGNPVFEAEMGILPLCLFSSMGQLLLVKYIFGPICIIKAIMKCGSFKICPQNLWHPSQVGSMTSPPESVLMLETHL